MTDAIKLVTPPTIDQQIKDGMIEKLTEMIEQARGGKITAFVAVIDRGDGSWGEISSGVKNLFTTIGMIEVAKQCVVERAFER